MSGEVLIRRAEEITSQMLEWRYPVDCESEVVVIFFTDTSTLYGVCTNKCKGKSTPLFQQDAKVLGKSVKEIDTFFRKNHPSVTWQWQYLAWIIPYRQLPSITFNLNPLYSLFVKFPHRSSSISLEVAFFDTGRQILLRLINRLRDMKLQNKEGYEVSRLSYNGKPLDEDKCFGLQFVEKCYDLFPYGSTGCAPSNSHMTA